MQNKHAPVFKGVGTSKQWNKLKLFIWYLAWNCVYISDGKDFHLHDEMDIYIPLIGQRTERVWFFLTLSTSC